MERIRVVQLSEVVGHLPEIRSLDSSSASLLKECDLFVCALGFENRCLVMPRILSEGKSKTAQCLILEFSSNRDDNETNRGELSTHLSKISNRVDSLNGDSDDFCASLRRMIQTLVRAGTEDSDPLVIVDTSVMSNRFLMRVMKVLLEWNLRLMLLYSEAAVYHPTKEEYEQGKPKSRPDELPWLDRGVSGVLYSQEYPGYQVDQLPDTLMVIPGFNRDRVRAAIHKVDPAFTNISESKVLWLLGIPHLPENDWRAQMMRDIHELTSLVPQYNVSTFDYRESLRVLEMLYQERVNQFRFTVAPMGSKMQSLGCALFCYLHPDVRVMFSAPQEYNAAHFSEGCRATWMIDIGSLKHVRELLDQVGMLRVDD